MGPGTRGWEAGGVRPPWVRDTWGWDVWVPLSGLCPRPRPPSFLAPGVVCESCSYLGCRRWRVVTVHVSLPRRVENPLLTSATFSWRDQFKHGGTS